MPLSSGLRGDNMEEWVNEIKQRASSGKPLVSGGRSSKLGKISFDDLVFIPAQLHTRPIDYFKEKISSETIIGKKSKKPLRLKTPILIGAMSFGAISKEAKIALAKASSIVGTATNTGEGGMLPEERKSAKILIAQYSTGRFGVDENYIKKADAIEIKIGQGAKPGCYTPDHEIFTENGFKDITDLKVGEKVWSVNPETNKLELAEVVKMHKYFHNGKMIRGKSKSIDFLVTPEHNLPIRLRSSRKWKFIKAGDALDRYEVRTSKRFNWNPNSSVPFLVKIPKIPKNAPRQKEYLSFPLKQWLQLSGWFISEGYCHEHRKIEISQTKEQERAEIENLLTKMGIDFGDRPTRLVIYSKQLGKFMEEEFGNISEEKRIRKWIRNLPKEYLLILLKAMIKGDGSERKERNYMTYHTASETLMNNVVEIAVKLGMAVAIRKYENTYEIDIREGKLWHILNPQPKKNSWQKNPTIFEENYEGYVYCPELDKNHTLIIKRNNRVSLNGNSGGLLPGEKVIKEIAKLRKVPVGKPIHSPPSHPDIKNVKDLKKKIEWLRDLNDGPIIIKLGAGDVVNDLKMVLKASPDAIAIDGMEGGTAAAPRIMLDDFGIPTLVALVKARKILDEKKAKQELFIGGGLNKGSDVAKALALGADAVFMGFPLLIAMGCTYCKLCHLGKCPFGIASHYAKGKILKRRLNIKDATEKVVNFITACTEEVKMAAAATGKRNIHKLSKKDLRALDLTVSKITGIPLV